MAAAIEIILILALTHLPAPQPPVPAATVQIHVMQPAPVPVAPKPRPAPPPPPKPLPTLPAPITPPVPVPPPASHHQAVRHVIRHIVHTPPPPPQPAPPVPTPLAPVAAAPPPPPVVNESAMSDYIGEVRGIVLSNLVVPQQLIDAGLEGDCVLDFTLAPDGTILSVSILTPSGLKAVNDAAVEALRASRLPAFLPGMPSGPHEFTLPVHVSGEDQ